MRNPHGVAIFSSVEADRTTEFDTITCNHCNTVILVAPPPAVMDSGFCRMCMQHICGPCADKGNCTPFEKRMEQAEAKERFLKSAGL